MNTIYIRDGSSRIVGRIQTGSQGKQFAYVGGRMVGIYNPQLDKTFDSRLHVFGSGNHDRTETYCVRTIGNLKQLPLNR